MADHRTEPRLRLGLTARSPTPDDAALILPLVVACDVSVAGESDTSLDEVTSMLGFPGVDNDRGGRLVLDLAGTAVGWLWTERDEGAAEVFIDVFATDPAISSWLFGRGVEYVRILNADRSSPLAVRAGCYSQDESYAGVIRSFGLEVDRRFYRMRLALEVEKPYVAPDLPPAITIQVAAPGDTGLRLLHRLHEESFADHWNHSVLNFQGWLERVEASAGVDPQQRYVAFVAGVPAGLLVADESVAEHGESYVKTLGVLREFRGQGVARALLGHAFEQAQARGRTRVGLAVDSASPTGATRLYEGMGMTVAQEILTFHGSAT